MMVMVMVMAVIVIVAMATNVICWNATHGELLSCVGCLGGCQGNNLYTNESI
jgi:hypothetical protein